jgi:hypothetical protein
MVMKLKNYAWFAVLLIAFTACSQDSVDSSTEESADMIITGARIFTSDKQQPWAEALAIKDGKFVYVGDASGIVAYTSTNSIDLKGELIIPGMADGHSHPGYVNVEKFGEVEGDTPEELLAAVKAYADEHPDDEWLRLCCWPTDMFVHGSEGPRKEVLDAVVPDRLVWFESATAHDFWLNSRAIERLGVDKNTPDPRPGLAMYARDDNGEPSGWIKEGAGVQHFATQFALVDEAHKQKHIESVAETLQVLSKHGVTSLFDAGNKGYGDLVYGVVSQLEEEGRLPVRYYGTYQIFTPERAKTAISEVMRYREEYGGDLLQFNSVKLFMDGISANQSAGFLEPYSGGSGTVGTTMLSVEELRDLLLDLNEAKLDLLVHTIGDLAVRTVLDAVEAAQAIAKDDFYPRVTVAHLVLIDPVDLPRIKELGIISNFTPWWMGVENNDVVREFLGEERYSSMYQARSVFDSGAVVSFSSDEWWGGDMLPTYISPYLGMQVGHTRQYPKEWWETEAEGVRLPRDERLSLEQLIEGYTRNGAYQLRREDDLGSIEVGKLADLVVIDNDLFEVDRYEIWKTKPSAVMMEGEVIQGSLPD